MTESKRFRQEEANTVTGGDRAGACFSAEGRVVGWFFLTLCILQPFTSWLHGLFQAPQSVLVHGVGHKALFLDCVIY